MDHQQDECDRQEYYVRNDRIANAGRITREVDSSTDAALESAIQVAHATLRIRDRFSLGSPGWHEAGREFRQSMLELLQHQGSTQAAQTLSVMASSGVRRR